jgi:hypothetical protein
MALGGPIAELRYACYPHDAVMAWRNSAWAVDYQRARDGLRRHPGGGNICAVEATAVHLVDMHWLPITRVAQALSVMGELDGAMLSRVVNGESVWRLWREQDALAG